MTRPSLYLAVTGVGSTSAIKASAAESTELDTPASGCWFSVHASTNASDIFTPEIQQFLRPLNLLQMNDPLAVSMQLRRTFTLTVSLFQREREPFGGTASGSPNSDLRRVRSTSPLPARSGERIKVRALPTAYITA